VEGGKERRNGGRAIGGRGKMGRSRVGGEGGRMIRREKKPFYKKKRLECHLHIGVTKSNLFFLKFESVCFSFSKRSKKL